MDQPTTTTNPKDTHVQTNIQVVTIILTVSILILPSFYALVLLIAYLLDLWRKSRGPKPPQTKAQPEPEAQIKPPIHASWRQYYSQRLKTNLQQGRTQQPVPQPEPRKRQGENFSPGAGAGSRVLESKRRKIVPNELLVGDAMQTNPEPPKRQGESSSSGDGWRVLQSKRVKIVPSELLVGEGMADIPLEELLPSGKGKGKGKKTKGGVKKWWGM